MNDEAEDDAIVLSSVAAINAEDALRLLATPVVEDPAVKVAAAALLASLP
jgi:hypothetical protein